MSRKPILVENFGISSDERGCWLGGGFVAQLHETGLLLLRQGEDVFKRLDLADVAGCHVHTWASSRRAFLTVFAYPKTRTKRTRQALTLFYDPVASTDDSLRVVEQWKDAISALAFPSPGQAIAAPSRPLLIILNPFCGSGQAEKVFNDKVVPLLHSADVDFTLVTTEYAGHAKELVRKEAHLDERFAGIVVASGDGLLHEIVNGLMSRPDWRKILRLPLGILPLGSANALSAMICFLAGENTAQDHVCQATFLLLTSVKPKSLNLMAIDTNQGRIYSALWLAWGIVSDVDIESEKMRWLGKSRFAIQTLVRLCNLRTYRGRLSFLPFDDAQSAVPSLGQALGPAWTTLEGDFVGVVATRCSHLAATTVINPDIRHDDHSIWLAIHRPPAANRRTLLGHFRAMGKGQGVARSPGVEWHRARAFRLEPEPPSGGAAGHILSVDGEPIKYGPVQAEILRESAFIF